MTEGLKAIPCLNIYLQRNLYHGKKDTWHFKQLKNAKLFTYAGVTLYSATCIAATMVHLQVMLSALWMNKNQWFI